MKRWSESRHHGRLIGRPKGLHELNEEEAARRWRRARGQAVRDARTRAGMSMGDLARAVGVSVVRVSRIERGKVDPLPLEADKILEVLHMNGGRW